MLEKIEALLAQAVKAIESAASVEALYEVKVQFLGKSGSFSAILKEMGKLSPDDRKTIGKRANEVRDQLELLYSSRENSIKMSELNSKLEDERIDVTLPGLVQTRFDSSDRESHQRNLRHLRQDRIFSVRLGPHVEKDFYNFDALNIPADHASRDLQDTFYVEDGVERPAGEYSPWILRTHTSPVEIRTMFTEKPPIRIVSPGGVYRSDSDMSHSPHFHQVEGLLVDRQCFYERSQRHSWIFHTRIFWFRNESPSAAQLFSVCRTGRRSRRQLPIL